MEKPLSVAREELASNLIQLINGCNLPPCVVAEVMHGLCSEVDKIAAEQLRRDKEAWEAAQKEEGEKGD